VHKGEKFTQDIANITPYQCSLSQFLRFSHRGVEEILEHPYSELFISQKSIHLMGLSLK